MSAEEQSFMPRNLREILIFKFARRQNWRRTSSPLFRGAAALLKVSVGVALKTIVYTYRIICYYICWRIARFTTIALSARTRFGLFRAFCRLILSGLKLRAGPVGKTCAGLKAGLLYNRYVFMKKCALMLDIAPLKTYCRRNSNAVYIQISIAARRRNNGRRRFESDGFVV